jgi:hypothetical protein
VVYRVDWHADAEGEAAMARKSSIRSIDVAVPEFVAAGDVQGSANQWFESQQLLLETGFGQLAQAQQAWLKSWLGLLDDLGRQWQAPMDGVQPFAWAAPDNAGAPFASVWGAWTPALYPGVAEVLAAWWSPWSAFVERGGEQLA